MTSPPLDTLSQRLQSALGSDYEVGAPLGAGGFAVVYLVLDRRLKRRLAVKVLSPDVVSSRSVLERFRREAETIAQLTHPNIVPLHFIGGDDDLLYLAMGFMDGGSLADRLKREPQLPIEDARRLLAEVASALAHAHRRGVIHRDIKPQNVLLDAESGRALVTDFGIARTSDSTSLTASGVLLGTPAYLAPEQVTGEPSDHRADLYSLGIMAYEIIAGRPPFEAATSSAVLTMRLARPPEPLRSKRPDVPADLESVVEGCLATNPDDRFQSASDVVRALTGQTPASGGHRTRALGVAARGRRRAVWVGAGVLVVAAGAVAALIPGRRVSDSPPAPLPVDSGMVLIQAGEYLIGVDSGPPDSRPAHRVTIPAFGIDRREVTVGEYKLYTATMAIPAPWPPGSEPPVDLPVTGVTFSDAINYCRWRHPDGGRLPSEEEWEATARGTVGRGNPWGEAPVAGRANVASGRRPGPAPVGTFPGGATPEGIVDLIGNVWEWTSSPSQAYPGGQVPAGSGPQDRIIRGGAWDTPDAIATPWWRTPIASSAAPKDLDRTGFRCAMNVRSARVPDRR